MSSKATYFLALSVIKVDRQTSCALAPMHPDIEELGMDMKRPKFKRLCRFMAASTGLGSHYSMDLPQANNLNQVTDIQLYLSQEHRTSGIF